MNGSGSPGPRALAVSPLLSLFLACSVLAACAPGRASPTVGTLESAASEPHWEDVFRAPPELLLVVFPRALRRDKVYGQLLRRAIDLARERSRVVSETRALDAMEEAEEVIVGFTAGVRGGGDEIVVVVRGAQANVDPVNLVDADGRALWAAGPPGPRESVRELVRATTRATSSATDDGTDASLFELPGHTWVIASGGARERARAAFAHPSGGSARGAPPLEDGSLAAIRFVGPPLVARIHALQPSGALAAVGRRLRSLTLELPPGSEREVHATLAYTDEDAAVHSEVRAREILETIARRKPERLAWLTEARVERPGERVLLAAPLPLGLVDGLMHAGAAALDLDGEPAPPPGAAPHL